MIRVTKRSGRLEELDLNKLHRVVEFACEGITGVSASEVEIQSKLQFFDGMKTSDVQETLIRAAADLITEDTPNYQWVASRLISYHLRKEVYGSIAPPSLYDHVTTCVKAGVYDSAILGYLSKEDFDVLNGFIDHDRDYNIPFCGMEQLRGKYLVRNRVTKDIFETPQFVFMLIAIVLFHKDGVEKIREVYDTVSTFKVTLPTPIMAGIRTPLKQFSSCVLIDCDDSLDSINAATSSVVKYVSQRAGIGINVGRIRALGSLVKNGIATHTGIVPFIKLFQAAVNSCSQGGTRRGSATVYYPFWHLEFEDLIVLKNNKGTEENRARQVDYAVQLNRLAYERLIEGKNITLFSPSEVPNLYEAFFSATHEQFKALYERYEADPKVRKKTISAIDMFSMLIQERSETGRIYVMNVDNVNDHGSYDKTLAPIFMSNLCTEIQNFTKPLSSSNSDGEIALCTLGALNLGAFKEPQEMEGPCRILVDLLNRVLDYQQYPILQAETATKARRPIGIGIVNLAYFLAKNGFGYQDIDEKGLELVHEWIEAYAYYVTKASADLAAKYGAPSAFGDTLYSKGIFPKDTYSKRVDDLVSNDLKRDWESLREQVLDTGLMNSTLLAIMPAETSAQAANATNGIEPPRALVSVKQSKEGVLKQVVPNIRKLKNKYDLLWNQASPVGYLKICAVIQKFVDQSISVNTSYNPKFYPDGKIPVSTMIEHMLLHYSWGGKTLYYNNTFDGAGEIEEKKEECDSCTI